MTDLELDKEMSDLNTSGNGEVTITEFLDYFERHRENGGGLIAKYIAQKKKREEPDWQVTLATVAVEPFGRRFVYFVWTITNGMHYAASEWLYRSRPGQDDDVGLEPGQEALGQDPGLRPAADPAGGLVPLLLLHLQPVLPRGHQPAHDLGAASHGRHYHFGGN